MISILLFATLLGALLIGLLIGSFLNVVIARLPRMLERLWAEHACSSDAVDAGSLPQPSQMQAPQRSDTAARYNLATPASHCVKCGHVIRWYENIPIASYLWLRGKCSACGTSISIRYPLVELLTGVLFGLCGWYWGWSLTTAVWAGFCAALVALAAIDWDTTLLPDVITLPLLWAGVLAALLGWSNTALVDSVWGAVAGYLSLWSVCLVFKLITGRDGMGNGDFKLLAALGAWLGWPALLPIVLVSSLLGLVAGVIMKFNSRLREGGYVPFGPFLAGAALIVLFTQHTALYQNFFGQLR